MWAVPRGVVRPGREDNRMLNLKREREGMLLHLSGRRRCRRLRTWAKGCWSRALWLTLSVGMFVGWDRPDVGRVSAEEVAPTTLRWSLAEEFRTGTGRRNPNPDRHEESCWYFLRTTNAQGPVETREWLRDGKYAPLAESGEKLFSSPVDGWAFRVGQPLAPLVGRVTAEYDVGLRLEPGDVLIAPGPEHAVVIGWRSPVAGRLEIAGRFEHGQNCCGVNSAVRWTVERGLAPDEATGFESRELATGTANFGTPSQVGEFDIRNETVSPGEFVYFIVDALADGTPTPHHGDATRLRVTITVHNAVRPPPPVFEDLIQPLLSRKCGGCHGADLQEAQLDLRTLSTLLRGGESGPAVVRGVPESSLLIDLVQRGEMPPVPEDRLSSTEVELLARWVKGGAPGREPVVELPSRHMVTPQDREFWAFQPPRRVKPPAVRDESAVRTPVDAFLLSRLESAGLEYSPEADRRALIRRASLDLTGLPPSPEAVQEFVQDRSVDAYERLIERLLHSPHYGERWARHWLDAAGYVDGKLDNDLSTIYPSQGLWRYRDYVVQAWNSDKPFDRFLIEQLAGDELVDWRKAERFTPETLELLTATGFLRTVDDHTDFPQYGVEKRYEVVNETLDMLSTAVMGLTLECCRCHNHKYDPLPQRDYYRLMACFEPAFNVQEWKPPKERYLADVSPQERAAIDARNAELESQIAEVVKREGALRQTVRERIREQRLASLPEGLQQQVRQALELVADKRSAVQQELLKHHDSALQVSDADVEAALTVDERQELTGGNARRGELAAQKRAYGVIQALWDVGRPPASRVQRRGNPKSHGVLVQPGFPEILQPAPAMISGAGTLRAGQGGEPMGDTSGRRLALARWLTSREHPLTARVFVNRVWHHHFGRGIVETLGNFGRSGSLPTHPELLDWLAVDFVEHGWSIRHLHRRIMLSTAYRQVSDRAGPGSLGNGERIDPANRLVWRMNLRRLEAELVRDAVLASADNLDRATGGAPIEISMPSDGLSEAKAGPAGQERRSLYLFARRVYPLKFLEIFDSPIMAVNCTQRANSTTVLQSLALLNSEFLMAQSERFATRLRRETGSDISAQVERAFQVAYSRAPHGAERDLVLEYLVQQARDHSAGGADDELAAHRALADLCHMLLSSSEFLYIE